MGQRNRLNDILPSTEVAIGGVIYGVLAYAFTTSTKLNQSMTKQLPRPAHFKVPFIILKLLVNAGVGTAYSRPINKISR